MRPDDHWPTDHPYILAFSLIMLHTDAFNKSNKNKMSKADYIKNTRLDGVLPEVLDVSLLSANPLLVLVTLTYFLLFPVPGVL